MLLEPNANVNKKRKIVQRHYYCQECRHVDVCTVLLEDNTNINEKLENDAAPLFQASQEGHTEVCTVLLEQNATVNEK